ncbi:MAG: hypothetical protein JWP76_3263 [Dactylosporangium sp.]|jgi:phenylacetate-coenzyme A ligase PaaK-like adenylate-forming protein|nr:hypothetical protein [Dactylosporangium sp.]
MASDSVSVYGTDGLPRPQWWHHTGMRRLAALAPGWRLYDEVHRHTQYNSELCADLQRRRLRTVLDVAADADPAHCDEVDPLDELSRRPVMTKQRLLTDLDRLRTNLVDPVDVLRVSTSGRTGEPVVIDHEEQLLVENLADQLRMFAAYGLAPDVRVLRVTCDPRQDLISFVPEPHHSVGVQLSMNVAKLDPANAAFVGRLCQEFAPEVLLGPPMEQLVTAWKIQSGMMANLGITMIWTYGDSLDALTRHVLAEVHHASVRDLYSLEEFGPVAWECPEAAGTYHINEERVLVERDGDGALVMTNLINRAMSIIRYRPEDQAQLIEEPCRCGRTLRRLTAIEGRQRGLIIDRLGNPMSVEPLRLRIQALGLPGWHVSQDNPGSIEVTMVASDEHHLETGTLSHDIRQALNQNTATVRIVSHDNLIETQGPTPQFHLFATQQYYAARLQSQLSR